MEFDLNQVRELLAILNQTNVEELCLKSNDFELTIRKGASAVSTPSAEIAPPLEAISPAVTASSPSAPVVNDKNWIDVTSPIVGTFYRSPAPDEPSFIEVGDVIRRGQTLCIIEAMKLMNELEAEVNGEVMEIVAENGKPIQFGDLLMRIKPIP
ncbi:MAG: acetyl-CoA carboxylase biotin carboxyl carrier protein [Thermosynechococcaceae cyanobacterium MS004]|nr:acetyl-CoA carboxylase biotin carboxyl carrier protein [Thermosynechococcaceae cyanobacterium MS004]